jgi:hypothetical protein
MSAYQGWMGRGRGRDRGRAFKASTQAVVRVLGPGEEV